jgi:hypothetical protein
MALLLFPKDESRAPKHGFWLMRGAQPATSADARLLCRKPDSGVPHHPCKGEMKKSILSLLCFNVSRDEHSNSHSGERAHASFLNVLEIICCDG